MKRPRLRLKKDLVIKAGTIFGSEGVPEETTRDVSAFVLHTIPFGKNATGDIYVGQEVNDPGFKRWFEEVK